MTAVTKREPGRGFAWLTYLSTALAAIGLKAHYSRATVADLAWVLEPTATVVGWLRRQPLLLDANLGWMAPDGSFVIAPACAGINFLILVFAVSVVGFAHRLRAPYQRCGWVLMVAWAAYLLTIAVNSLRIAIAVALYQIEVHAGWLTPERVHRVAGSTIYLAGLWTAWIVLDHLSARFRSEPASSGWAFIVVPGAYIGMTVVVPLLNGAWCHFGARYLEHAITVSLVAVSAVPLLSLVRWATSWSTGAREGRHGQTDDSGGRRRAGDC
jgi:exosortase K